MPTKKYDAQEDAALYDTIIIFLIIPISIPESISIGGSNMGLLEAQTLLLDEDRIKGFRVMVVYSWASYKLRVETNVCSYGDLNDVVHTVLVNWY